MEFRQAREALYAHDLAAGCPVTASNVRGAAPAFAANHLTDGRDETYWATDDGVTQAELVIDLGERKRIAAIRLEEHTPLGQRIAGFAVDVRAWGQWLEMAVGTTIGPRRVLQLPPQSAPMPCVCASQMRWPAPRCKDVRSTPGSLRRVLLQHLGDDAFQIFGFRHADQHGVVAGLQALLDDA